MVTNASDLARRRLFVTEVYLKPYTTVGVMLSIGAGEAIKRSKQLRDRMNVRFDGKLEILVKRYDPLDHDFLLGLAHLRVSMPDKERKRRRLAYWLKVWKEAAGHAWGESAGRATRQITVATTGTATNAPIKVV